MLSYNRRVCTAHMGKVHLGCPAQVNGEAVPFSGDWIPQDTFYIRPLSQARKTQQHFLIHRNKHKEAAKMRRQRNMAQMKEQNSRKTIKQNGGKHSTRCRIENTTYKDAR